MNKPMAKRETLREISNGERYIGRITSTRKPLRIRKLVIYEAELEDRNTGLKQTQRIGKEGQYGMNYPLERWNININGLRFTENGLEITASGSGVIRNKTILPYTYSSSEVLN